jgi:hypothetical protein
MTIDEGVSRAVKRHRPDTDIVVADVVVSAPSQDGSERLVRVSGLSITDYLTPAEALALARELVAAVAELTPPS